jgi:hypothetical protein
MADSLECGDSSPLLCISIVQGDDSPHYKTATSPFKMVKIVGQSLSRMKYG